MRLISLCDDSARDAFVGINPCNEVKNFITEDSENDINEQTPIVYKRIIKSTTSSDITNLISKNGGNLIQVAKQIIAEDIDVDMEETGRFAEPMKSVYVNKDNKCAHYVYFQEELLDSNGEVFEKRAYTKEDSNIQSSLLPIRMTGLYVPIEEAVRRFAFTGHYQLHHLSGLTFDFLFDIAKKLEDSKSLAFVGAGENGTDPIVLVKGGKRYRGFLYGKTHTTARSQSMSYSLQLLLTDIDLKDIDKNIWKTEK